jgi:hypothetical protein
LFNCCFTSDAHPLAWLAPKINTSCTLLFTLLFLWFFFLSLLT